MWYYVGWKGGGFVCGLGKGSSMVSLWVSIMESWCRSVSVGEWGGYVIVGVTVVVD